MEVEVVLAALRRELGLKADACFEEIETLAIASMFAKEKDKYNKFTFQDDKYLYIVNLLGINIDGAEETSSSINPLEIGQERTYQTEDSSNQTQILEAVKQNEKGIEGVFKGTDGGYISGLAAIAKEEDVLQSIKSHVEVDSDLINHSLPTNSPSLPTKSHVSGFEDNREGLTIPQTDNGESTPYSRKSQVRFEIDAKGEDVTEKSQSLLGGHEPREPYHPLHRTGDDSNRSLIKETQVAGADHLSPEFTVHSSQAAEVHRDVPRDDRETMLSSRSPVTSAQRGTEIPSRPPSYRRFMENRINQRIGSHPQSEEEPVSLSNTRESIPQFRPSRALPTQTNQKSIQYIFEELKFEFGFDGERPTYEVVEKVAFTFLSDADRAIYSRCSNYLERVRQLALLIGISVSSSDGRCLSGPEWPPADSGPGSRETTLGLSTSRNYRPMVELTQQLCRELCASEGQSAIERDAALEDRVASFLALELAASRIISNDELSVYKSCQTYKDRVNALANLVGIPIMAKARQERSSSLTQEGFETETEDSHTLQPLVKIVSELEREFDFSSSVPFQDLEEAAFEFLSGPEIAFYKTCTSYIARVRMLGALIGVPVRSPAPPAEDCSRRRISLLEPTASDSDGHSLVATEDVERAVDSAATWDDRRGKKSLRSLVGELFVEFDLNRSDKNTRFQVLEDSASQLLSSVRLEEYCQLVSYIEKANALYGWIGLGQSKYQVYEALTKEKSETLPSHSSDQKGQPTVSSTLSPYYQVFPSLNLSLPSQSYTHHWRNLSKIIQELYTEFQLNNENPHFELLESRIKLFIDETEEVKYNTLSTIIERLFYLSILFGVAVFESATINPVTTAWPSNQTSFRSLSDIKADIQWELGLDRMAPKRCQQLEKLAEYFTVGDQGSGYSSFNPHFVPQTYGASLGYIERVRRLARSLGVSVSNSKVADKLSGSLPVVSMTGQTLPAQMFAGFSIYSLSPPAPVTSTLAESMATVAITSSTAQSTSAGMIADPPQRSMRDITEDLQMILGVGYHNNFVQLENVAFSYLSDAEVLDYKNIHTSKQRVIRLAELIGVSVFLKSNTQTHRHSISGSTSSNYVTVLSVPTSTLTRNSMKDIKVILSWELGLIETVSDPISTKFQAIEREMFQLINIQEKSTYGRCTTYNDRIRLFAELLGISSPPVSDDYFTRFRPLKRCILDVRFQLGLEKTQFSFSLLAGEAFNYLNDAEIEAYRLCSNYIARATLLAFLIGVPGRETQTISAANLNHDRKGDEDQARDSIPLRMIFDLMKREFGIVDSTPQLRFQNVEEIAFRYMTDHQIRRYRTYSTYTQKASCMNRCIGLSLDKAQLFISVMNCFVHESGSSNMSASEDPLTTSPSTKFLLMSEIMEDFQFEFGVSEEDALLFVDIEDICIEFFNDNEIELYRKLELQPTMQKMYFLSYLMRGSVTHTNKLSQRPRPVVDILIDLRTELGIQQSPHINFHLVQSGSFQFLSNSESMMYNRLNSYITKVRMLASIIGVEIMEEIAPALTQDVKQVPPPVSVVVSDSAFEPTQLPQAFPWQPSSSVSTSQPFPAFAEGFALPLQSQPQEQRPSGVPSELMGKTLLERLVQPISYSDHSAHGYSSQYSSQHDQNSLTRALPGFGPTTQKIYETTTLHQVTTTSSQPFPTNAAPYQHKTNVFSASHEIRYLGPQSDQPSIFPPRKAPPKEPPTNSHHNHLFDGPSLSPLFPAVPGGQRHYTPAADISPSPALWDRLDASTDASLPYSPIAPRRLDTGNSPSSPLSPIPPQTLPASFQSMRKTTFSMGPKLDSDMYSKSIQGGFYPYR